MEDFLRRMDKKWGSTTVFVVLILIFVGLLGVASSFLFGKGYQYSSTNGGTVKVVRWMDKLTGGNGTYGEMSRMDSYPMAPDMAPGMRIMPMPMPYPPATTGDIGSAERDVVQTGSLDIVVPDAEGAASNITSVAKKYSGVLESTFITETYNDKKTGHITIRVPADRFHSAMNDIKSMAIRVKNEQVNSYDVTEQSLDYENQLASLQVEQRQYERLLEKSTRMEDTVVISSRLTELRNQILWIQGQINGISRQVTMSSITVMLEAQPNVDIFGITWHPFEVLKRACRIFLEDAVWFINGLIYFIFKLPILIFSLILLIAGISVIWHVATWLYHWMMTDRRR